MLEAWQIAIAAACNEDTVLSDRHQLVVRVAESSASLRQVVAVRIHCGSLFLVRDVA